MASGKFQGVIRPTTPRGTWRVNSSERPSDGGKLAPSGSSAAAAWKRRMAAERATSPRASAIGLPTSRQISDASSPASTSSRSAAQRSASPRAAAVACAQPGAASAARRTAWSRSIPPDGRDAADDVVGTRRVRADDLGGDCGQAVLLAHDDDQGKRSQQQGQGEQRPPGGCRGLSHGGGVYRLRRRACRRRRTSSRRGRPAWRRTCPRSAALSRLFASCASAG